MLSKYFTCNFARKISLEIIENARIKVIVLSYLNCCVDIKIFSKFVIFKM